MSRSRAWSTAEDAALEGAIVALWIRCGNRRLVAVTSDVPPRVVRVGDFALVIAEGQVCQRIRADQGSPVVYLDAVKSFMVRCAAHVTGHEVDASKLCAEVRQGTLRNVAVSRVSRQRPAAPRL